LPYFPQSEATGRVGVSQVALKVSSLGWAFREQPPPDLGIDAQIEICDGSGLSTGKLIGCQIKSGRSFFEDPSEQGFIFRSDSDHLAHWLGHSLPIIIVLCNPDSGICYWQVVTRDTCVLTGRGWKIEVPAAQILGSETRPLLERLATTGFLEYTRALTTPDKFFSRTETNPLFDYEQTLQGRASSVAALDAFLTNDDLTVAVVPGRGGIGKSRLLRHWLSQVSGWTVLCKKEATLIRAENQQEIDINYCLVVVDDAHRQTDIEVFLQLARDVKRSGRAIKVLLSCRPIGIDRIRAALSRSFDSTAVDWLDELKRLSLVEVRALAAEVLGGELQRLVPFLADASRDTPLVTVIGGRLLRKDTSLLQTLPSEDEFRRSVFDKFIEDFEQLAGAASHVRPLLHLISILQPVAVRSPRVLEGVASFVQAQPFEIALAVSSLEASGLLLRSGDKYRIAPDMFADFLLEQASVALDGSSNGFAEAVYRAFGDEHLPNVLKNIAELDFRVVRDGRPSLMTQVWLDVRARFEEAGFSERLRLIKSIQPTAFFQPGSVLALLRIAGAPEISPSQPIEHSGAYGLSQTDILAEFPAALRAVAYHPQYRNESIGWLWEMAKATDKFGNRCAQAALSALKDLASYSRYKAVEVNMEIARRFHELANDNDSCEIAPSPFDIIDVLLKREAEEHEFVGRQFSIGWLGLNHEVVAPIRRLCLQTVEDGLNSKVPSRECRAFRSAHALIWGFLTNRTITEDEKRWQNDERLRCIAMVKSRLALRDVSLPLAQQVKADFEHFISLSRNDEGVNEQIRSALALLPSTPDLDAFDVFCRGRWDPRGAGTTVEAIERSFDQNIVRGREAAKRFRSQFVSVDQCLAQIVKFYEWARDCHIEVSGAYDFIDYLCDEPEFLNQLSERLIDGLAPGYLASSARVVSKRLRETDRQRYLSFVLTATSSGEFTLAQSAAWGALNDAFDWDSVADEDRQILDFISGHTDEQIRINAIGALAQMGRRSELQQEAITRILAIALSEDKKSVEPLCDAFIYGRIPLANLSVDQLTRLLMHLVPIPELDGHSIGLVLNWTAEHCAPQYIRFIAARIDRASELRKRHEWAYQIVSLLPSQIDFAKPCGIDADAMQRLLMSRIELDSTVRDDLLHVFWRLVPFSDNAFEHIRGWLHSNDAVRFNLALGILRSAPGRFVFAEKERVIETLEAAQALGDQVLDQTMHELSFSVDPSAIGGFQIQVEGVADELRKECDMELQDETLHPLLRRLYERAQQLSTVQFPTFPDEDEEF